MRAAKPLSNCIELARVVPEELVEFRVPHVVPSFSSRFPRCGLHFFLSEFFPIQSPGSENKIRQYPTRAPTETSRNGETNVVRCGNGFLRLSTDPCPAVTRSGGIWQHSWHGNRSAGSGGLECQS